MNLELDDSEVLTLRWLLIQDLPYARGRMDTNDGGRRKTAEIILKDIYSILSKLPNV